MNDNKFEQVMQEIEKLIYDVNPKSENYLSDISAKLQEAYSSGNINESQYNYCYGVAYFNFGDDNTALEYAINSYEAEENIYAIKLTASCHFNMQNFEEAFKYAVMYLKTDSEDEGMLDICSRVKSMEIEGLIFGENNLSEDYFSNIVNKLEECLESKYIVKAQYDYYYGMTYTMLHDYETALEYTLKSYQKNSNLLNTRLLADIYLQLNEYEESLKYGLEFYEQNPDDDFNNTICANAYCGLGDYQSAFEMIKDVDYQKDQYQLYSYLQITLEPTVINKKDENFKQQILNLCIQNTELLEHNINLMMLCLRFSSNNKYKQLNDIAFDNLREYTEWKDDVYYRYYIYFYRLKYFMNTKDTENVEKIFASINQDSELHEHEEYSLKEKYLSYFFENELVQFEQYSKELIKSAKSFEEFLGFVKNEPTKYLKDVYELAIKYQNAEYVKHYGAALLYGHKGITQDINKAKEMYQLSNQMYEEEYKKASPCITRYLSDLEIVAGNYEKAIELALKSAVDSETYCNCGVRNLLLLIIEGKTNYSIDLAKEIAKKSIDGYMLRDNFTYEKIAHTNVGINEIYAYFALKGEEGFSKRKILNLLKEDLEKTDDDFEVIYYIARILKSLGSDYKDYQDQFIELLNKQDKEECSSSGRYKIDIFKNHTDIDDEVILYNPNRYLAILGKQ